MPTDDAFDVGSVGNSAHRRLPRLSEASPKLRPPFCALCHSALRYRKRGDAFACYSPGLLMVVFYTFTCCFFPWPSFVVGSSVQTFFFSFIGSAHNIIAEVDILSSVFLNMSNEQQSLMHLACRFLEVGIKRTFTYIHNVVQSFQDTTG